MLKKSSNKYYIKMWNLTVEIFNKYDMIKLLKYNDNAEKESLKKIYEVKLYDLLIDILNQDIFGTIKEFSADDIEFILELNLDKILPDILKLIYKEINIKKVKKYFTNK